METKFEYEEYLKSDLYPRVIKHVGKDGTGYQKNVEKEWRNSKTFIQKNGEMFSDSCWIEDWFMVLVWGKLSRHQRGDDVFFMEYNLKNGELSDSIFISEEDFYRKLKKQKNK